MLVFTFYTVCTTFIINNNNSNNDDNVIVTQPYKPYRRQFQLETCRCRRFVGTRRRSQLVLRCATTAAIFERMAEATARHPEEARHYRDGSAGECAKAGTAGVPKRTQHTSVVNFVRSRELISVTPSTMIGMHLL